MNRILHCTITPLVLQVFFVIRLRSALLDISAGGGGSGGEDGAEGGVIRDPDPPMSNELMDGRDAFLTLAREKHYEFSSLRRTKYSTLGMLYELHAQLAKEDTFVHQCSACRASVETRFHCSVCDVSHRAIYVIYALAIYAIYSCTSAARAGPAWRRASTAPSAT